MQALPWGCLSGEAEGSQPGAWTLGAQSLERMRSDGLGEGSGIVVAAASGKSFALFSFLSEMRSRALS